MACPLAPPVPNAEVIETLSEEELKSGKEGLLMVPFHANPDPLNLTWYLDGLTNPLGMNETRDRFSSRGWIQYVSKTTFHEHCAVDVDGRGTIY